LKEIRILVPDVLYKKLELIERKYRISKEDLITKTIIRIIETYLGGSAYESAK